MTTIFGWFEVFHSLWLRKTIHHRRICIRRCVIRARTLLSRLSYGAIKKLIFLQIFQPPAMRSSCQKIWPQMANDQNCIEYSVYCCVSAVSGLPSRTSCSSERCATKSSSRIMYYNEWLVDNVTFRRVEFIEIFSVNIEPDVNFCWCVFVMRVPVFFSSISIWI